MTSAREALERFLRSTGAFAALLEDVSDERWTVRPDGEEWSVAETVEHVVLTDRATLARFRERLFASPVLPGARRFPDERISDEMFRAPAPPGLAEPTGRFATGTEGRAALADVRDAIAGFVDSEAARLRDFALPHPVFGPFDGVQWVLFLAAHTDNHVSQLARLSRTAKAPKEAS
jgi:hypothetical protein